MNENPNGAVLPPRVEMERAFSKKDQSYDGVFYVAVRTTGIFCRPSCPSRPKLVNVEFHPSIRECLFAGYRPCRRCRPLETNGAPPAWAGELIARVEATPDARIGAAELRALGVSPERARRWFKRHYGMSFAAWCRGFRMASAFTQIRQGSSLDDVTFGTGFESHSGFRDAFARTFGQAPGRSRHTGSRIVVGMIESAGASVGGGSDEGSASSNTRTAGCWSIISPRCVGVSIAPSFRGSIGSWTNCARNSRSISGRLRKFTPPILARGTPFQERVWSELRRIPCGETISYDDLARRIGQPTAQRAVARANGMNRICILIPCHRVIGKDGTLTGYGGGLWRKATSA